MLKRIVAFILIVFLQIGNVNAKTDTVIASVNDRAITVQELKNRIKLTTFLIQQKVSELEFNLIKNKSLEDLIEEELKIQYAEKLRIHISEEELAAAVSTIEKQKGIQEGKLLYNIPEDLLATAMRQIKDSIYDEKIIKKNIIPTIFVSNSEVDRLLKNIVSKAVNKEFNISRLTIKNEKDAKKTIAKIYEKLKAGDKFEDIATAFSSNGELDSLGWFSLEELNIRTREALENLDKGEFSMPISDNENFYIIKVNDIKVTKNLDKSKTKMYRFTKFQKDDIDEDTISKVVELSEKVKGFNDFQNFSNLMKNEYSFSVTNSDKSEEEIAESDKKLLENMFPGNFSKIEKSENNLEFVYLVDKQTKNSPEIEKIRNRIRRNLENREVSVRYRSFLQQLRKDSFVEIR